MNSSLLTPNEDERQCLNAIEQAYKNGDQSRIRPTVTRSLESSTDVRELILRMLKYLRHVSDLETARPRVANILLDVCRQFIMQNVTVRLCLPDEIRELWPHVLDVIARLKQQSSLEVAIQMFGINFEQTTLAGVLDEPSASVHMLRLLESLAQENRHQQIVHLLMRTHYPRQQQHQFPIDLFLVPLFANGHLQEFNAFCDYDASYVPPLVRHLDEQLFNRHSQWPTTVIAKTINRLLKIAQTNNQFIPASAYPKAQRNHLSCVLSYLVKQRFRDNAIGPIQFADLIRDLMHNQNTHFKIQFLDKLTRYKAEDDIREWIAYFRIPSYQLPYKLSGYCTQQPARNATTVQEQSPSRDYKQLSLDANHVHFVDSVPAFNRALAHLERSRMIGIDAEWKPFCAEIGRESDVALLQLANETDVYLIDVLALKSYTEPWMRLVRVFQSNFAQKIGFNICGDFKSLYRTVPNLGSLSVSPTDFIDLGNLFRHLETLRPLQPHLNDYNDPRFNESASLDKTKNSYQSLSCIVRTLFGRDLDKSWQISNWELRPLRPEQITYAALDAHCLVEVFKCLQRICDNNGVVIEEVLWKVARHNYQKKIFSITIAPQQQQQQQLEPTTSNPKQTIKFRFADDLLVFNTNVINNDLISAVRKTGFKTHILADSSPSAFLSFSKTYRKKNPNASVFLVTLAHRLATINGSVPFRYCLGLKTETPVQQLQEIVSLLSVELDADKFYRKCLKCGSDAHPQIENAESTSEDNFEIQTSTHYRYFRDEDDDDDDDDLDNYDDDVDYGAYDDKNGHDYEELQAPIVFTRSQNQPAKTVLILCCDSCNYHLKMNGCELTSLQQTWLSIIRDM